MNARAAQNQARMTTPALQHDIMKSCISVLTFQLILVRKKTRKHRQEHPYKKRIKCLIRNKFYKKMKPQMAKIFRKPQGSVSKLQVFGSKKVDITILLHSKC